jgi:hypothetical protein
MNGIPPAVPLKVGLSKSHTAFAPVKLLDYFRKEKLSGTAIALSFTSFIAVPDISFRQASIFSTNQ